MGDSVGVARGADELERLLRERTWDLRRLDSAGFRAWLRHHLARWEGDPIFRQRAAIRAIRRNHPELRQLEQTRRAAVAADAASPPSARLRDVERASADAGKAVAGLAAALAVAPTEQRHDLSAKLVDFQTQLRILEEERAALSQIATERHALLSADAAVQRVRSATGLIAEEARLAELLTARGRRAGRVGDAFEDVAAAVAARGIVSDLVTGGAVRVLRRVRLGAAGIEFDALVVRVPAAGGAAAVLAAIEAKRDINGVAHGFLRRQADLAWLTTEVGGYDPAVYRTRTFPTGHFDRPVEHRDGHGAIRLGPGSFSHFRRDTGSGWFADRLYLATRPGPLWGVSPAALARIAAWVATDEAFDPDDQGYLVNLHRRCRALAGTVEAPDVLRAYATDTARARQVLFVGEVPHLDMGRQPGPMV